MSRQVVGGIISVCYKKRLGGEAVVNYLLTTFIVLVVLR